MEEESQEKFELEGDEVDIPEENVNFIMEEDEDEDESEDLEIYQHPSLQLQEIDESSLEDEEAPIVIEEGVVEDEDEEMYTKLAPSIEEFYANSFVNGNKDEEITNENLISGIISNETLNTNNTVNTDMTDSINTSKIDLKSQLSLSGPNLGVNSSLFSPLKLKRAYGRTEDLPVHNLVGIHSSHIIYPVSNLIVLFDFYQNHQYLLQGHKNKIGAVAINNNCKLYASADYGPGSSILLWDLTNGFPCRVVEKPHNEQIVDDLTFIPNEHRLASIGRVENIQSESGGGGGGQEIFIWNFENDKEDILKPEICCKIPKNAGKQNELVFNEFGHIEHFASTGNLGVVFYSWAREEKMIATHIPKITKKFQKRVKHFTQSLWTKENDFLTVTMGGFVIIWGTPISMGLQETPDQNLNIKEFKRSYKLGDNGITCFIKYKEYFVIGDTEGEVKFFDNKFRLVRWTKHFQNIKLPLIKSISFNKIENTPPFKLQMRQNYDNEKKIGGTNIIKDYTFGGSKFHEPSQTTLGRHPLRCPDFVIGCNDGSCYYFHIAEARYDELVPKSIGSIIAFDSSPISNYVVLCNKKGETQMYDYVKNNLLFSGKIFHTNQDIICTCLKFHPAGAFVFFGTESGLIYSRRSFTWDSKEAPLENSSSSIKKIVFSSDGAYMAHSDASHAVSLYNFNSHKTTWDFKGKIRSHSKSINDLLFCSGESGSSIKLFSLSADRKINEYDIKASSGEVGLKILQTIMIEQEANILAMIKCHPFKDLKPFILISNDKFKLRLMDLEEKKIRKTIQGPCYGSSINKILELESLRRENIQYYVFVSGNRLGLAKSPMDGNPYRFMAVLGHPKDIIECCVTPNNAIFTIAAEDNSCIEWEPNISALEMSIVMGGSGLGPFIKMLDANCKVKEGSTSISSWYEDLENCFYYFMMKRVESQSELFNLENYISLHDIPTVLRTCGYFPSEYEIDLILEEVAYSGEIKERQRATLIGIEDFVKLFANHRQWPTLTQDNIVEVFEQLGEFNVKEELFIKREDFKNFITKRGEVLNEADLPLFLPNLYKTKLVGNEEDDDISQSRRSTNRSKKTSTIRSTSVISEGSFNKKEYVRELFEEIKIEDFLNFVLPQDSLEPIDWNLHMEGIRLDLLKLDRDRDDDEEKKADPSKSGYERWLKRDSLRYFWKAIEYLKQKSVPISDKLITAFEMDYFANHERFPNEQELNNIQEGFDGLGQINK